MDLDDPEAREQTIARLRDVLDPFNSVVTSVFYGLLRAKQSQPVTLAFLLTEVLPALGNVNAEMILEIVCNILDGAPASTRLAAIEALDIVGVTQAKRLMASIYPGEKNRIIRNFIDASLRAG